MTLSQIKTILEHSNAITFKLPDGTLVPAYFHVTEVGKVTRDFIDCGGKRRHESVVNFQLWSSTDYDHRLHPEKLLDIITLSQRVLELDDLEIEVEYQSQTIGKYGLDYDGDSFLLTSKFTDCLAADACGVPAQKPKVAISNLNATTCAPGSGCC